MSILIKNGTVVLDEKIENLDIYIEDEKIQKIGKNLNLSAEKIIVIF